MLAGFLTSYVGAKVAKVLAPVIWVVLATIVAGGVITWQRLDAVADYKTELRAEIAERRLGDTKHAKEMRDEIQDLTDDALLDALLGGVRRVDPAPRPAGAGCDYRATPDGADGPVSCPQ